MDLTHIASETLFSCCIVFNSLNLLRLTSLLLQCDNFYQIFLHYRFSWLCSFYHPLGITCRKSVGSQAVSMHTRNTQGLSQFKSVHTFALIIIKRKISHFNYEFCTTRDWGNSLGLLIRACSDGISLNNLTNDWLDLHTPIKWRFLTTIYPASYALPHISWMWRHPCHTQQTDVWASIHDPSVWNSSGAPCALVERDVWLFSSS